MNFFWLLLIFFFLQENFAGQVNVLFTDPYNNPPSINQLSSAQKPIDFALRDFISSANSGTTMYMCIYEINNTTITTAVDDAVNKGVKVYSIFHKDVSTMVFKTSFEYKKYGSGSQYMHNKFVVIKSSKVWTGSYNFTVSATNQQDNFALEIFSKELAEIYEKAFLYIWDHGNNVSISTRIAEFNAKNIVLNDGTKIISYFNPYSQSPELLNVLTNNWYDSVNENSKVGSLYFCVAWFTENNLFNILKILKSKNVLINGIVDDDNDNFNCYYALWSSSVPVYFDSRRTILGNGLMHHKFCVTDPYKPNAKIICGSANWSDSALRSGNDKNYENIIVIESQKLAEKFYLEYLRLYDKIKSISTENFFQEPVSNLKIYPNPVKKYFKTTFVPSKSVRKINLSICTIYGRVLMEQKNINFYPEVENNLELSLNSEFTDGIYYLLLEIETISGPKKYYKKFLVER
ncbi:MAG: phospholipase D-like domain-containing protein [Endomicrobiia bacterium]